jgi:hypothetical protein
MIVMIEVVGDSGAENLCKKPIDYPALLLYCVVLPFLFHSALNHLELSWMAGNRGWW